MTDQHAAYWRLAEVVESWHGDDEEHDDLTLVAFVQELAIAAGLSLPGPGDVPGYSAPVAELAS